MTVKKPKLRDDRFIREIRRGGGKGPRRTKASKKGERHGRVIDKCVTRYVRVDQTELRYTTTERCIGVYATRGVTSE